MNHLDLERFRVANPEALGQREKDLWVKIEPVVAELLDELKRAGKIESVYVQSDIEALLATIRKLDEFSLFHNFLIHLTDSESLSKDFFQANSKFGLDEPKLVSAYIMAASTVTMLSTELFKLFLLFFTREIDRSVANFNRTIESVAPNSWPKLKPFVDNTFRNAIAHGTYAIVNKKIRLFRDARLETVEEMSIADFMMRIKDQNVLYQVLVNAIVAKGEKGFFAPS